MIRAKINNLSPEGGAPGDVPRISTDGTRFEFAASSGGFIPNAGRSPRLVPYGVKLRGANVVPMDSAGNPWATLYANWSTKWDTIVKPQIDDAASVGANSIRLIGDIDGVVSGTLTVEAYVAAYEQFVDYCANLGLYVYACLSAATGWGGSTKDQALVVMEAQAAMLERKSNVIGIDVVQELGLSPALWTGSTEHDFVSYLFTALRDVTTLPLTCSVLGSSNNSSAQWSTSTTAAFADLVDFYDFHPYYTGMTTADLAPFFAANTADKPLVLGEYGGTSTVTSVHQAGAAVSALPQVVGSFIWSIVDNSATDDWALFDWSWAERTALTSIFRTVPDREQFTDGGHTVQDEGITLPTRSRLNFVGDVTAEDDAVNDATVVRITIPDPGPSSGGAGELLMQDGVTAPPVPLETETRDDWLYQG